LSLKKKRIKIERLSHRFTNLKSTIPIPKTPVLDSAPEKTAVNANGEREYAAGAQTCKGIIADFTPNPISIKITALS